MGYLGEIILVLGVIVLLTVGRSKLIPKARSSGLALWTAFIVTVICGLVLGYALHGVVSWFTHLHGHGAVFGYLGSLIALTLGWWSVEMLVHLIRDLADGRPDGDARRAALYLPMFLPAGWAAVGGLISHPQSLGAGIVAAIEAVITVVFLHMINRSALAGQNHTKAWRWFLVPVNLLAGVVMVPLILFADATLARYVSGPVMAGSRILGGVFGLALLVAAIADISDRIPDRHVRTFLAFGLPLLFLFGSLAVAAVHGGADNGLQLVLGASR
jgi:hypothetical protein